LDGITCDTIWGLKIVLDTASFVTAVRSSGGAAGEVLRMIFREDVVTLMDFKPGLETARSLCVRNMSTHQR